MKKKKIRYADESLQHAMMLANLLAVRYAGSVNPNGDDIHRTALALTTGLGIGKVTMGQINDIVDDIVAYHSDEGRAERKRQIDEAANALDKAERAFAKAKLALDNAAYEHRKLSERDYALSFTEDDFRFMR